MFDSFLNEDQVLQPFLKFDAGYLPKKYGDGINITEDWKRGFYSSDSLLLHWAEKKLYQVYTACVEQEIN